MEITIRTPWSRIREQNSVDKEFLEIVGNGSSTGSVLEETIAVSVTISISVQKWHNRIRLRILSCNRMREMRRVPEVPEERVPVGDCFDGHARITSEELAPIHSVKCGTLQKASSTRPRAVADLGKSALTHIAGWWTAKQKVQKEWWQKCSSHGWRSMSCMIERWNPLFAVTHVTRKATDLLCAAHQEHDNWVVSFKTWSRRSLFHGRFSDMQKPIPRVKFTKAIARHTKIRDQNPSLKMICPSEPHQRSPNAPKFEDRSQEETEWQERCAREAARRLAKNILKLKEKTKSILLTIGK